MVSPENWLFNLELIEDDSIIINPISTDSNFPNSALFTWPLNNPNFGLQINGAIGDLEAPEENTSKKSLQINGAIGDLEAPEENTSKKRARSESCGQSSSKACREKLRRDRLNEKFVELGSILEPGRPPKTDKAAILSDAVRMVTQLRDEAQKLKDSNVGLQEKIKELKAEKNELRDEKQMLKSEKIKLEQLKTTNAQPSFLAPPALPAAYAAQGQVPGSKLVPVISYPGVAIWQFMPPAAVDTSQDHILRPPVA